MTEADRPRFAQVMAALGECFREPLTDARVALYFDALGDLEIGAVEFAARGVMRTGRFFPKPAELRQVLPSEVPDESEAWGLLMHALRDWRPFKPTPPVPPALQQVIYRLGGWNMITGMNTDDLWRRFSRLYQPLRVALVARDGDPRTLPELAEEPIRKLLELVKK